MSSEKSDAIVLRVVPFSETSAVVTLLTRDFGKVSALAKGAWRPKSPFEGALDLGCHCRVVFIKKASDSLDLLTEAKLQRRFRAANKSLDRLYAGYYIIELCRELTEDGEPHAELFDLVNETLTEIDSETPSTNELPDLLTIFELQSLKSLGHAPAMVTCAACGTDLPLGRRIAFGMLSGGVLCSDCRPREKQVVMLSDRSRSLMHRILNANQRPEIRIDAPVGGEIRGVMNRYMSHHVGRQLKMHKLISHIARKSIANRDSIGLVSLSNM